MSTPATSLSPQVVVFVLGSPQLKCISRTSPILTFLGSIGELFWKRGGRWNTLPETPSSKTMNESVLASGKAGITDLVWLYVFVLGIHRIHIFDKLREGPERNLFCFGKNLQKKGECAVVGRQLGKAKKSLKNKNIPLLVLNNLF